MRDIGGMIGTRCYRYAEVGTQKRRADLSDEFLEGNSILG